LYWELLAEKQEMRLDLSRRGKARSGSVALAENENDSKISFTKLLHLLPTSFGRRNL
jgi:hypothetical protein